MLQRPAIMIPTCLVQLLRNLFQDCTDTRLVSHQNATLTSFFGMLHRLRDLIEHSQACFIIKTSQEHIVCHMLSNA